MKITESELNLAYTKVNEIKNTSQFDAVDGQVLNIDIDRNPLIDSEYFNEDTEFVTPVKLEFKFDKTIGLKGAYQLMTQIEIIEEAEEED